MPVAVFDYSNPLQSANKGIFGQSCVKATFPATRFFFGSESFRRSIPNNDHFTDKSDGPQFRL